MNDPVSAISKHGIHTICPEILSEIFLFASHSTTVKAWEDEDSDTFFHDPSLEAMPCKLTRVCKGWRKLALSTPRLWSHIEVRIGYSGTWGTPSPSCYEDNAEAKKEYAKHLEMVFIWL